RCARVSSPSAATAPSGWTRRTRVENESLPTSSANRSLQFPLLAAGQTAVTRLAPMGAWYTIGLLVGLGAAFGVLAAALAPRLPLPPVVGAAAGVAVGLLVFDWRQGVGGAVGGLAGGLAATP